MCKNVEKINIRNNIINKISNELLLTLFLMIRWEVLVK